MVRTGTTSLNINPLHHACPRSATMQIYVDMNMAQILKYACIFQWQNSMRAHDE